MHTFGPLAVVYVCGCLVVCACCVVDVIPEVELIVFVQCPKLSRRVGFQPIRRHPSVAVGIVVEGK